MKRAVLLITICLALGCTAAKPAQGTATPTPAPTPAQKAKKPGLPRTESIQVSHPFTQKPEAIWPWLAKVEDWGAWNEKVTLVEPGSGLGRNAKIRWQYDEKDLVSTVVSLKEREELAFSPAASGSRATLRWLLQPRPDGTTLVTLKAEVPYGTASSIMEKLGREINEWMAALKAALP